MVQLPIWKDGPAILDINTQWNSLKINWIRDYLILPMLSGKSHTLSIELKILNYT